ncbi:MAG: hypothetical protein ACXW5U_23565 [Thermoanaerobaculia bacterium]
MASTLHVALWSVNTTDQNPGSWLRKPMRDKLSALTLAVSAFFRFRLANGNVATTYEGDAIRAIFVAPEYFLAETKDQVYGDRDYVDEMTARAFAHLIPGPINTLLVPGSIGVRKKATSKRLAKYLSAVPSLKVKEKTGFIRNTAYGFIHSRKVLKCSKQGNATDGRSETDPDVFVPGWSTNKALLNVHDSGGPRQLRFAVEICADASAVRSGTPGYVDTTDTAGVDVKILVSAVLESQHVYHGNYTRALVHACSDPAQSGVVVKGNNTTAHVQRQAFMGHQLDFYSLTLP